MFIQRGSRSVAVLLLATAFGSIAPTTAEQAESGVAAPVVYVGHVNGIIHPVSAEYMIQTMDLADRAGAAAVVFTLQTPGGLLDSTRDIVTRMLGAKTPVVVFVAPSGARAASAGFLLTLAADVAVMAPGTHIGAAHPVAAGAEPADDTLAQKAAEDVAAYARTLAGGRLRNVTLADEAVNDSRAFTEQEALGASPPLIDLIATDLPNLLDVLNERPVRRFDGTTATLTTANARLVAVEMTWRQRVLSAIAHPNIALILLSLGILGLTIELWTPGAILPGVVGGISLLLAFFALQLLPVNYAGLLLIVLGLLLLGLELVVTSYGLLTIGGLVSLVFGALILIDAPEPELRLSFGFVGPVVLGLAGIAVFLVRLAVIAQRKGPASGATTMIGALGEALTPIEPGQPGQVRVGGEIWRATSPDVIAPGARVRVTSLEGLTLTVRHV